MQELKLERIQENNWKQGVIVENPLREQIISESQFYNHIKDSDLLILYTQDCDLINLSLEKEPFVEFFCVKRLESINHDFSFGKNPRKMHLEIGNGSIYEFDINKRVKVDRKVFVDIPLEAENPIIPRREMDIILGWFSKKYSRPAFPDAFNKIIKDIPKIDRQLTKINRDFPMIKRLFFSLDPEQEIDSTENYSLGIYILLSGLSFESDENLKDTIVPKFEELFSTERINLIEVVCVFEDEMTIYDLGIFKVWDKEYITLKNDFPD